MLLPGKKDADILAAFLNEGVPLEAFHRLDQTYRLDDLIERRTDAVSAYVTNEPWQLLQQGLSRQLSLPGQMGLIFTVTACLPRKSKSGSTPGGCSRF